VDERDGRHLRDEMSENCEILKSFRFFRMLFNLSKVLRGGDKFTIKNNRKRERGISKV
jgi:hypothetical protein